MSRRVENVQKQQSKIADRPVLRVIGTIALICVVTGAMLACMAAMYVKMVIMPDADLKLTDFSLDLTTSVYYKDKKTGEDKQLQALHAGENRIWIDYEDIPKNLINAAVSIEDKRFYKHHGVDWIRTSKGIINMFTGQDIQGGSTITQQLIKNLTTENQVTVKRKVKEIFRALEFEDNYSKEKILEWYLNCIFLGEGCNGIYTASYAYFGKNVSELSLAECASLIGITNNPSQYDPYRDPKKNKVRQENILDQMYAQGKISKEECDQAKGEELKFIRGEDETREAIKPYGWYVDAVIDQVISDLKDTYNLSDQAAAGMVYSGGLQIYSCLDPAVQAAVDAVYSDRGNLNYTSPSGLPMQSAITIVDNQNGNVVALAGGVGQKTESRVLNRATQTKRPPGSSIKPLAVYSQAIEMGLITPLTVETDSPYEKAWPVNSYGSYRGKMTMIEALRVSCNTVAVKVLAKHVTPEVSYQFMRDRFHIKLVESRTIGSKLYTDIGLAQLALGGLTDGVSTYDMAAAYSVFPRGGIYYKPSTYTKVLDNKGKVLLERDSNGQVALKQKTTFYINNMLQEVVKSGTGTSANFSGMTLAGKTGTTTLRKDLWFAGYSPYYTAAVWTGYDKQEAMRIDGNPSAVMWRKVMQKVHANLSDKNFTSPDQSTLVTVEYCKVSGLLATSNCGGNIGRVTLSKEDAPKSTCKVHKAAPVTKPFDINDPTTWPTNDPNFNAEDPTTWPKNSSGGTTGTDTGDGQTPTEPTTPETPKQNTKPKED
ncbi:MAG: Multimodular transpeptidase-transglycosylase [Evtepia sp.]|nr:Multimodular transpeptidase-transglycosylase [Evtepia sp.]